VLISIERQTLQSHQTRIRRGTLQTIIRENQQQFGLEDVPVSRKTINNRLLYNRLKVMGRGQEPPLLHFEDFLATFIITSGDMGFPIKGHRDILQFALGFNRDNDFAANLNSWKKLNLPAGNTVSVDEVQLSPSWVWGFLKRTLMLLVRRDRL